MTGFAKGTVLKFLADMGEVCREYHHANVRGLTTKNLQCDEIWAFVAAKDRNLSDAQRKDPGVGSVWTWTALDADSKLMISWQNGVLTGEVARPFMRDVADRIDAEKVQVATDGLNAYWSAIDLAFGDSIDFAQAEKAYGKPMGNGPAQRYSPAVCLGCICRTVSGQAVERQVRTSHVERSNLTMRMGIRRFTRLTNVFSKKIDNHRAAVALHFMH